MIYIRLPEIIKSVESEFAEREERQVEKAKAAKEKEIYL
jgi:hypothetical protein